MINIAKILEKAPKGTKLYSLEYGTVTLEEINLNATYPIIVKTYLGEERHYYKDGRPNANYMGECLLFPSKEQRDWSKFKVPCQFKPFDKVVVRNEFIWHIDFFERYEPDEEIPYKCIHQIWLDCLPYNEETAKLIGTSKDYK